MLVIPTVVLNPYDLKNNMSESISITKSAGIIIIGNEILSGKVMDTNSHFLASELRLLGVNVLRISVIPDDIKTIGEEALLFSRLYDFVFTTGGIGPTHDDMTIEAISGAFGVKMILNSELAKWLNKRYGNKLNNAVLKMALVPEGAELLDNEGNNLPVIFFKNIIILPGVPQLLKKKFFAIKELFRCSNFFIKKLFIYDDEAYIADLLTTVAAAHPNVMIGSYPIVNNPEYRVIVTVESKSEETLNTVIEELLNLFPQNTIVKIE